MSAGASRDPGAAPEPVLVARATTAPTSADAMNRIAVLRAQLSACLAGEGTTSPADRAALRSEISALIRAANASAEAWRAVADAARTLPELWKQLPTPDATNVPNVSNAPGVPLNGADRPRTSTSAAGSDGGVARSTTARSDHLGASTHVAKGWTAYAAADFTAAEAAFERALALAPDEAETTALLAWARASLGREDDALLTAQRVLVARAVGPAASLARVAVGRVCLEKGIEGEAIEHLARVVCDNDDRRATLYATLYLGVAYQRRGMYDDSIAFLRRALALGPNLVEARYALGCTLWRAGAPNPAGAEWRTGAAGVFSPWARRCEERLREVDGGAEVRA